MNVLLSLEGVSVALGARRVVHDASLTLAGGEIAALLGANGAGKSSLLRAGAGLIGAAAGRVRVDGVDIATLDARTRARRVAYLGQTPEAAWPISVEALAALGRFSFGAAPGRLSPADEAAVTRALGLVGLQPFRTRSLDTLSGGERARAHLARALAQGAQVLALDEPTAELDPAHALAVLGALRAHAGDGGGVLFTTHDVAFAARAAHRVHVMAEGRIIASGAPRETLTPAVLLQAYRRNGRIELIDGVPAIVFT